MDQAGNFIEKNEDKVQRFEERAVVTKIQMETGFVRVSKSSEEHMENFSIPLSKEELSVERIAVNKEVDSIPEIRVEDGKTIISVIKEVAVIIKKLIVVEEIHITKRSVIEDTDIQVPLRREHIDIADRQSE